MCKICSKLTIQTPERRHWHRSGLFIVNFEHNSHLALVFILTSNLLLSAGIHNILSWPSIKCNICVLQSSPSCRLETTYSNSALARLEQLHQKLCFNFHFGFVKVFAHWDHECYQDPRKHLRQRTWQQSLTAKSC